jgi:drug/metabolite transporter (DMT)-like permease
MNSSAGTVIAVLAGLAAGGSFGTGVALQYRQAQLAPAGDRAPVQLLAYLARQRLWLAGNALAAAGYGFQALALAFGPLALVAPVAATDLLFALPLAARWSRQSMRARDYAGCLLTGGGVAAFLAASPPSAGHSDGIVRHWVLAFAVVGLVSAIAVFAAGRTRASARASLLALAAATLYGLVAALTLNVIRFMASHTLGQTAGHWQCWVLAAVGVVGILLSVSMHKAGPLSASLPVIDTVEPISAVLIGTLLFGERLAGSPAGLALQLAGAVTAIYGVVMLGRSSSLGLRGRRSESAQQRSLRGPERRATRSEAA